MTAKKELMIGLICLAALIIGKIVSVWLEHYLSGPEAKGLAFFAVFLVLYLIFRKPARFGLLPSVGLCLLAGLLALVGELIWPGW